MYFIIVEIKSAFLNRYVSPVVFFKTIFYLQYRRSKKYKCCLYLCNRSLKHLMVRYNQYVAYNDNIGGVRKDLCSIFFGGWGGGVGVFNSVVEKHSQGSWLVTSG